MLRNQLKQRYQGYEVGILLFAEDDYSEFYLLGVSGRLKKPNVATQACVTQGVTTADPL